MIYQFLDSGHLEILSHKDMRNSREGEFLFIGSDAVATWRYSTIFGGSITMDYPFVLQEKFVEHLQNMTPESSNYKNPWFMDIWMKDYNCTFEQENTKKQNCEPFVNQPLKSTSPSTSLSPTPSLSNTFDGFYAICHGLHNLITWKCPEAFLNASILSVCLDGNDLLNSIKNNTFNGSSWTVAFDDSGDIMSPYTYKQWYGRKRRNHREQLVGMWDKLTGNISINNNTMNWETFGNGENVTRDAVGVPDSVCSYPCRPRQYPQQRELVCCWDCMTCRNNEIINADRDGCEKCPELMWPDDETATKCITIKPE